MDDFAKKNPDQAALDDLKKKIEDKTKLIQDLESRLATAKREKADLQKKFQDQGGKP